MPKVPDKNVTHLGIRWLFASGLGAMFLSFCIAVFAEGDMGTPVLESQKYKLIAVIVGGTGTVIAIYSAIRLYILDNRPRD